ncbi:hypothetical protein HYV64_01030 [Candidatus Shapirobacteria bacterium]|nr:hypothetical protein [Candidatus Shapirobacteria bacterium]
MINKNLVITALLVIVFTGLGFGAGIKFQQKRSPSLRNQFQGGQMQRGALGGDQNIQRGRLGGGMTNGEIIGVDDQSITVKMPDGSSKVVLLSSTTTINKSAEGSISDLKTGEKVAIFGSTNSDGSLTAQSIQLNPILRLTPSTTPTNN